MNIMRIKRIFICIPRICIIYIIQRFIINAETIGMKGDEHMAVILNKRAYEHAKRLVEKGRYVFDEKDIWSERINCLHKKRTSILKRMVLRNLGSGIWESTQMKKKIPKDDINSLIAILPKYIAAECLLQRTEPDNINIMILNRQPRICMA